MDLGLGSPELVEAARNRRWKGVGWWGEDADIGWWRGRRDRAVPRAGRARVVAAGRHSGGPWPDEEAFAGGRSGGGRRRTETYGYIIEAHLKLQGGEEGKGSTGGKPKPEHGDHSCLEEGAEAAQHPLGDHLEDC